jgi:hypothetical protein
MSLDLMRLGGFLLSDNLKQSAKSVELDFELQKSLKKLIPLTCAN